jgi:hypothetical protein
MKRKDGTWDTRSGQPELGYEFFENNLRCSKCWQIVPDDSFTCPFCLKAESPAKNPTAKQYRRNPFRKTHPDQERLPLNGYRKLD